MIYLWDAARSVFVHDGVLFRHCHMTNDEYEDYRLKNRWGFVLVGCVRIPTDTGEKIEVSIAIYSVFINLIKEPCIVISHAGSKHILHALDADKAKSILLCNHEGIEWTSAIVNGFLQVLDT